MLCQYCGAVLSSPRELKFRACWDCDDALHEDHDEAVRELLREEAEAVDEEREE